MRTSLYFACVAIALLVPVPFRFLMARDAGRMGKMNRAMNSAGFMCLTDTSRGTISFYKANGRKISGPSAEIQLPRSTYASVKTPRGRVGYRTPSYPQRPSDVAISPGGHFAYVTNQDAGEVLQYRISSSGTLKPLQPSVVRTGPNPVSLILDKTGRYLYVSGDDGINQYCVDSSGAIKPLTPGSVPGGDWPSASCFAVTADNRNLYCLGQEPGQSMDGVQLDRYLISADGTLSRPKSNQVSVGSRPTALCISPDSHHVYVPDFGENFILTYNIGADGRLRQLPNARIPVSDPAGIVVTPDGRRAYVISTTDNVMFQFHVLPSGLLTALKPARVRLGFAPQSVTVDTNGQFVLIGGGHQVTYFPILSSGGLGLPHVLLHQSGYPVVAALFNRR